MLGLPEYLVASKSHQRGIRLAKLPGRSFFVSSSVVSKSESLSRFLQCFVKRVMDKWTPSTMAHMLWKFLQADALVNCILAKVSHCHLAESRRIFSRLTKLFCSVFFWEALSHKQCEACTYICISVMKIYIFVILHCIIHIMRTHKYLSKSCKDLVVCCVGGGAHTIQFLECQRSALSKCDSQCYLLK